MRRYLVMLAVCMMMAAHASAQSRSDGELSPEERAQADDRARELYMQGDELYTQGKYEQAIVSFEASYRLSRRPLILIALANAHERLAHYRQALDALRLYLPNAPAAEKRNIRERIRTLERRVERAERAGRAGTRAEKAASDQARAEKDPGGVGEGAGRAGGAGARASANGAAVPGIGNEVAAQPETKRPLAGWILLQAGTAAFLAGGAMGLIARSTKSDIGNRCRDLDSENVCLEDAESLLNRHRRLSLAADVGMATGLVALSAGVLLLLRGGAASNDGDNGDGGRASRHRPGFSVQPGASGTAFEVNLVGRF